MEAQSREEDMRVMISVEDSTAVKSELLRKRGRPRKVDGAVAAVKESPPPPPNEEKKEKTRCLTEIEEEEEEEEEGADDDDDDDEEVVEDQSISGIGVEVYAHEELPAVTSPAVTRGRRRPRKGVPRRAPL